VSELLSRLLVAFTIEFDNESEHRSRHRTTSGPKAGPPRGPYLVSQVMWANFLQFIPADGIPLREVADLTRITNLRGMERWGYVVVEPDPADGRPAPPRRDWVVRPTRAGRRAQQVWGPLAGIVEDRWRARFGADEISALRNALLGLIAALETELPPYLPVISIEMFAQVEGFRRRLPAVTGADLAGADPAGAGLAGADLAGADLAGADLAGADLSVLLSQVLLAFTLDFERESAVSLAVAVNALRVLTEDGVRVRDLPRLTGVSKEALSMATGVLVRRRYAAVEPDPTASRTKLVRLTASGRSAQQDYRRLLDAVEQRWQARFGDDQVARLRRSLHALTSQRDDGRPRLAQGLQPYPDGWRARNPYARQTAWVLQNPDEALPRYPMVLHRGGWPDGS